MSLYLIETDFNFYILWLIFGLPVYYRGWNKHVWFHICWECCTCSCMCWKSSSFRWICLKESCRRGNLNKPFQFYLRQYNIWSFYYFLNFQAYFITNMEPIKFWEFMSLILVGLGFEWYILDFWFVFKVRLKLHFVFISDFM